MNYRKIKNTAIILIILQVLVLVIDDNSKEKNNQVVEVFNNNLVTEERSLGDIFNELNQKGFNILSIKEESNGYLVEIQLLGKKDKVIESLNQLKDYNINDCEITISNDFVKGSLFLEE